MTGRAARLTGRVVTDGQEVADGVVVVAGGRVMYAGPSHGVPDGWARVAEPRGWRSGLTLLPGLVDIHCHGGAGGEFGTEVEAGARAAAFHHRAGTTTVVASVASLAPDPLVAAVRTSGALTARGAVAGTHLEGPFLSVARRGAQNPAALTDVVPTLVDRLARAAEESGSRLVQMTHAPERDPSAALPRLLGDLGCVTALGHTDTDARSAADALDRAATWAPHGRRPVVTHVFNGMPPLHHRTPGPVAASLASAARGEAVLEVIGDGVHLDPETVRMLFETVGAGSLCLVTDAMAAAGMADGDYRLGGLEVAVQDGVARLAGGESIAGGTATLLDVVRRCVLDARLPLADVVTAATSTPASALGLRAGSLAAGSPADVLVVDDRLRPVRVMRGGDWLS